MGRLKDVGDFALKVEVTDTCWLWRGTLDTKGYGRFKTHIGAGSPKQAAHRWLYKQVVGPVADELDMDHLCKVHNCVNPDHLEPVTRAENIRRGNTGIHNRIKTHCPAGHEYSPENTWLHKQGYRVCRTCGIERMRKSYAARKAVPNG